MYNSLVLIRLFFKKNLNVRNLSSTNGVKSSNLLADNHSVHSQKHVAFHSALHSLVTKARCTGNILRLQQQQQQQALCRYIDSWLLH